MNLVNDSAQVKMTLKESYPHVAFRLMSCRYKTMPSYVNVMWHKGGPSKQEVKDLLKFLAGREHDIHLDHLDDAMSQISILRTSDIPRNVPEGTY